MKLSTFIVFTSLKFLKSMLLSNKIFPNVNATQSLVTNLPSKHLKTEWSYTIEVGMEKLIRKRNQLTAYLEFILHEIDKEIPSAEFEIITPKNQQERGCQLSLQVKNADKRL